MSKVKWIDRELIRSQVYYCLCTTEKQYLKEVKRLKVPYPDPWLVEGSTGTAHFFDYEGSVAAVVTMAIDPKRSMLEHEALLIHEAVHIYQEICRKMREKMPGKEFEAYSIQRIALNLLHKFHKALAKADPKVVDKINRLSKKYLGME
jgi:hypothetical protein